MKTSGIGGQAVLEGVMMKNKNQYAVAVRRPDQEIEIKKEEFHGLKEKCKLFGLPIFRGMAAFGESLVLGMRTLTWSSSFYEEEEEKEHSKASQAVMDAGVILLSVALAIAIFVLFPLFVSSLLGKVVKSETLQLAIEGLLRLIMFIAYVALISRLNDIKRVFMYHGAEHKCINCVENGAELTVANVRRQSRCHKRCGTSFLLVVMLVSFVLFMFIRVETVWVRYVLRIVLIPLIAGISYEFIRVAGSSDNKVVNILSKPGLWLQGLTTKEPDDSMIEVAIASVEAVFDWREFQETAGIAKRNKKSDKNQKNHKNHKNDKKTQNEAVQKEAFRKEAENAEKEISVTIETAQSESDKQDTVSNVAKDGLAAKVKETEQAVATKNPKTENAEDDLAGLDKVFEYATNKDTSKDASGASEEQAAAVERKKLRDKVRTGQDMRASITPDEEEDDEILRALDKYFSYEGEKTVMERGEAEDQSDEQ